MCVGQLRVGDDGRVADVVRRVKRQHGELVCQSVEWRNVYDIENTRIGETYE